MIEVKEKIGLNVNTIFTIGEYTLNCEDMGKHNLIANISIPIEFVAGVEVPHVFKTTYYVEYNNDIYYLNSEKPTGVKDNENQNIKYTIIFESKRNKLDNVKLKNVTYVYTRDINGVPDTSNPVLGVEFTSAPSFFGNIYDFVLFIRKNLEYTYGLSDINIKIDGVDVANENTDNSRDRSKTFTLDIGSSSIFQSLVLFNDVSKFRFDFIKDTNGVYWIILDSATTTISKIFQYGGHNIDGGLLSITRTTNEQITPNRIYGVGGTDNLPVNYYALKERIDTSGNIVIVDNLPSNPDPMKVYLLPNPTFRYAYDTWIYVNNNWQNQNKPYQERVKPFPKYMSYYSNLMPKCFREYLKGWNDGYIGITYGNPAPQFTDEYWVGYADGLATNSGTETYKPITYYQNDNDVAIYGIKDTTVDFTDIIPTITEMYASDGGNKLGRLDEIVDVYVPNNSDPLKSGKYWEDTDNIITDQYGNKINTRVPFMYIPPTHTNTTTQSANYTYNPNVVVGNTTNYSTEALITLNNPDYISFSAKNIRLNFDSVMFNAFDVFININIKLQKKSGNSYVDVAGNPVFSLIKNEDITYYKYAYFTNDSGEKSYTTHRLIPRTINIYNKDYLSADNRFAFIHNTGDTYTIYAYDKTTDSIGNTPLNNNVYYVEVKPDNNLFSIDTNIYDDNNIGFNGDFKIILSISIKFNKVYSDFTNAPGAFGFMISPFNIELKNSYTFSEEKTFFIWTKNLFFNPSDKRWNGGTLPIISFNKGKLAGFKFQITNSHSVNTSNGVYIDQSRNINTKDEEGNAINVNSYYCIELKTYVGNSQEETEYMFDEIPKGNLTPNAGDIFVIDGVRYPFDPYVYYAEQKLENALIQELNKESRYSYSIVLDHIAISKLGIDYNLIKCGNKIKIKNDTLVGTSNLSYAELTIKSVQISRTNDQYLDRYIINISNIAYKTIYKGTQPPITNFDRDVLIGDINSLVDTVNKLKGDVETSSNNTNRLINSIGSIPSRRDIGTIIGQIDDKRSIFGEGKTLEGDVSKLDSDLAVTVLDLNVTKQRVAIDKKAINTKNKKLNTLLDFRDDSVLGFFSYDKEGIDSVEPDIIISDNILYLESPIYMFEHSREYYYNLEAQTIELEPNEVNYIYVNGQEFGTDATLYASTELMPFTKDEYKFYLIGYVNPTIDEEQTIEYVYIGDKKIADTEFGDKEFVSSPNVKRIEILNELPPPELQEEGVLYGIYI